ncbi:MAG: hypothetical protein DRO43_02305 [Candidatus Hecatellales archaeon]|nr:MAG: hypothetical protein DRO43_02305 [Candidatus Hecatellales archaeon]
MKPEGSFPRIEEILARVLRAKGKASEVLTDKEVASLGDAYLNFAYSTAQSLREGKPRGLRLDNRVLAEAVKKAGLRGKLPKRLSRREIGGAAEALLAYATARGMLSAWELIEGLTPGSRESLAGSLARLLSEAYRRLEEAEEG